MLNKVYPLLGVVLLGLYGAAAVRGWEWGTSGRETAAQATARHQSGGHRSTWISGYRGGK
jgi:hypothetical protein